MSVAVVEGLGLKSIIVALGRVVDRNGALVRIGTLRPATRRSRNVVHFSPSPAWGRPCGWCKVVNLCLLIRRGMLLVRRRVISFLCVAAHLAI